jgi:hypothetical protein
MTRHPHIEGIWHHHFGPHRLIRISRVNALPPAWQPPLREHSIRLLTHYYFWPSKPRGLGGLVRLLAHPIAKLSDRLFHTRLQTCPACQKREKEWDQIRPIGRLKAWFAVFHKQKPCGTLRVEDLVDMFEVFCKCLFLLWLFMSLAMLLCVILALCGVK